MANLFKRGQYFWVKFQHNGKVYRESTKETSRSEAKEAMYRIIASKRGEAAREELVRQLQVSIDSIKDQEERSRVRRSLASEIMGGQGCKVAIAKTWETWLRNPKKRNPGERTLQAYHGQWRRFENWLKERIEDKNGIQYLHEITPAMAEEYATYLWEMKITPSTYNSHLKFLRAIFRILKTQAGISINPWTEIPTMPNAKESKRNLSPEELKLVCSTAKGNLRYWLAIGLYTGLRLGDVVTLKWDEIDFKQGIISRVPMKTRRTNKIVRFPIHPILNKMLIELRKTRTSKTFLFPEEAELYQRDPSAIVKLTQKHFIACGIKTQDERKKDDQRTRPIVRVGFHSLRHSFVSLCAAHRVPQVAIMELVGHGSPAMTALYSHAGDEQKAKAIAELPKMAFGNKR